MKFLSTSVFIPLFAVLLGSILHAQVPPPKLLLSHRGFISYLHVAGEPTVSEPTANEFVGGEQAIAVTAASGAHGPDNNHGDTFRNNPLARIYFIFLIENAGGAFASSFVKMNNFFKRNMPNQQHTYVVNFQSKNQDDMEHANAETYYKIDRANGNSVGQRIYVFLSPAMGNDPSEWIIRLYSWNDSLHGWVELATSSTNMPGEYETLYANPYLNAGVQIGDELETKSTCESNGDGPLRVFDATTLGIEGSFSI